MDGNSSPSASGGPLGRWLTPTSSSTAPGPSSLSSVVASSSSQLPGADHAAEDITPQSNAIQQRWPTLEKPAEPTKPSKMSKRPRATPGLPTPSELKFVYLLGFDNLYQPVRADMTLLRHYGCLTQKSIDNNDPPAYIETDGVPVYNSWMTRLMLICFLKSLTLGKMCLGEGVNFGEASHMFDYEGICVPNAEDAAEYAKLTHSIEGQAMGVGMNKRSESLMESTARLTEAVSNAIVEWPRLEHGLESAFSADDESAVEQTPVAFTCTPTRCWVRFVQPPKGLVEASTDPTYGICKRRPFWLASTLYAIGSVYSRLVTLGKVQREDYSEAAFFALEEGIKHDPSGHFVSTRIDVPRAWRERAKRTLGASELFAVSVLNEVVAFGPLKDYDKKVGAKTKFSRACVALAIKMATNAPKIANMLAAGCEDDKGTTPERAALSKALKAHNIKVIRWGQDVNALIFPPSLRGVSPQADGPCVLLGFENMR